MGRYTSALLSYRTILVLWRIDTILLLWFSDNICFALRENHAKENHVS